MNKVKPNWSNNVNRKKLAKLHEGTKCKRLKPENKTLTGKHAARKRQIEN